MDEVIMGWGTGKKRQRPAGWRRTRMVVMARADGKCQECGDRIGTAGYCDHIEPWHAGGSDGLENLQWLCRPCHARKWRQEQAIVDPGGYPQRPGLRRPR